MKAISAAVYLELAREKNVGMEYAARQILAGPAWDAVPGIL